MIDFVFFALCAIYACTLVLVLYVLRHEPLYDPRVLFTLAGSLWLFVIHGYLVDFEGYLAAKNGFYQHDLKVLSVVAITLWLVGYVSFVSGASLGMRLETRSTSTVFRDEKLLVFLCGLFVFVALVNFSANVVLISGGNVFKYLSEISLRSYQVAEDRGVSAAGYLFGFIAVQILAFIVGRRAWSKSLMFGLVAVVLLLLVVRFSQARIFQTLVLLGACYVSYSLGAAKRAGSHTPWVRHIHYLAMVAALGVGFYFLRLASALSSLGIPIDSTSISQFGSRFAHFALERGNVPNFPIVFTIVDKMPSDVDFLYGKTLFNWAIYAVPKSILPPDYLISIWVKNTWYLDIQGGGLPPTAVGEWYANFGITGVVIGMFAVGAALGLVFRMARNSENPFVAVLWANLAFGFVVIYPKTDLAQVPVFSILVLVFMWFSMKLLQAAAGNRH